MLAPPGARAAITCDAAPPAQVTVETVMPAPAIDATLDLAALARRARRDPPAGALERQLGLTTVRPIGNVVELIDFAQRGGPAPAVCGALRELKVTVGFEDIVIHIAREMARDRCLYDTVHDHEQRHVRVDREVLAWFAPRVEASLRAAAARIAIVRAPTQEAVWAQIRQHVQAAFDAEFRAMLRERARRQQLVDRPEEYQRVAQACGGALRRLLDP